MPELLIALRGVTRRPTLSLSIIATLGLAIGANVAVFSVLYGMLLRPLPFPDADRLVAIEAEIGGELGKLSARELRELEKDASSLADVAAFYPSQYNMTGDGPPESQVTMIGTTALFRVLGVRPVAGDTWSESLDWTTQYTVMLSHGLWQRRFGSDPSIVGRSVMLDNGPYIVSGVLPPGFDYPAGTQLYRAVSGYTSPETRRFTVLGRLRPGATLAEARTELATFADRFAAQYPETNRQTRFVVRPLRDGFVGQARPYLVLLAVAVGTALLLAIANVANLLLARAIGLRGELAVRTALGASRARLLLLVAADAGVLAVFGGGLGLILGALAVRLLPLAELGLPSWLGVRLEWPVLAFAGGLIVVVALAVAFVPGLLMSGADPRDALLEGTRRTAGSPRTQLWQRVLVAMQVAVAVVLLTSATLLVKSMRALEAVNPGFLAGGLMTFRVDPPSRPYNAIEPIALFYRRAVERLRALPGVTDVGHNETLPFGGRPDTTRTMTVEGRGALPGDADQTFVNYQVVGPSYFAAMGIPVVRGRVFTADDRLGTVPVAVVSARTARRFWPEGDPVGERIRTTQRTSGTGASADVAVVFEIIGVVGDVHFRGLDEPPGFDLYASAEQTFSGDAFFVLRTASDPASLAPLLAAAVQEVDPNQSIFDVRLMSARIAAASWQARTSALVLAALALIGLVLAAVGTYGVLAYAVAQRRREIGVRAALGADARAIRGFVLRQGLRPVAVGVAVGGIVALVAGRALGALLHEISPIDPLALLGAPLALAAVAGVACLLPAARAARVDPAEALRID
jgi:putative ABC transport system permease protein